MKTQEYRSQWGGFSHRKTVDRRTDRETIDYSARTPHYYLQQLDPQTFDSFSSEQLESIVDLLEAAIPKPAPKIVDLRFVVNLIFSRFYIVLFVGKDRRTQPRRYALERMTRVGNLVGAIVLLIGTNLLISAFILLAAYLVKSAIGIDLTPGHISDLFK